MTIYIENPANTFSVWRGEALANGLRISPKAVTRWTAEDRAAVGLYDEADIAEADPVPEGKISTGITVQRVDGVVKFAHTLANAPAPTKAERKADLIERVRQKRWEVETGGIAFNGVTIPTDEKGQNKIAGAIALFDNDPEMTTVDWEPAPGSFVTLDEAAVRAMGVAVGRHIQACFSRSKVLIEDIQAADTHAELDTVEAEIEDGWP